MEKTLLKDNWTLTIIGENVYNTPVDYVSEQKCMDSLDASENAFSPQRKNLASVIRGINTVTTSYALNHGIWFGWQTRFHDHIIRNDDDYRRHWQYIDENPKKWVMGKDVYYGYGI